LFTGIIEIVSQVNGFRRNGEGAEITLNYKPSGDGFNIGESIAVDGVCLTVKSFSGEVFSADISPETLAMTTLGEKTPGCRVNIERAMSFGGRVGGHFVTGHIDGTGLIKSAELKSGGGILIIEADGRLMSEMVKKGSVAVDGISLTIAEIGESSFSAAVIPHTLENTVLKNKVNGDKVNIETDMIGKYVRRALSGYDLNSEKKDITMGLLKNAGFAD